MSIRVALHHETHYHYDRRVSVSPQTIRLRPAPHCRTPVTAYSLEIFPPEHFLNWQQDPQGNFLARAVFPEKMRELSVTVNLVAEMTVINPFDFFLEPEAESFPFAYEGWLATDLAPFLEVLPVGTHLRRFLDSVDYTTQRTVDFLVGLNQRLARDVAYVIRMEPGVQSCEETLELRRGSCRDTAWVLVQALRNLGLAARFVSGYLIQLKPDVRPLSGPMGPSEDFTDLHAWAEVYLPGAGWVGLDPTSGLLAGEGHLPLATAREPRAAAPISGVVDPCEVEFDVVMSVSRIHEDPRVTQPYTESEWERIDALGRQVDADLRAADVRLTMGGEPTFVSVDDMDGDEWNTAADGPNKRRLADALVRRLRDRFAPGGLLHHEQGKWYPGEPLPRWALTCCWRPDGVPVWEDHALVADGHRDYGFGHADAARFLAALAEGLGISAEYVRPAYEDPWHYLEREGQLPINVDPSDSKLEDPLERDRIRRVLERGISAPAGYVLPLERVERASDSSWQSGLWMLRAQHLMLLPGDSPLGLRLPLQRLPWAAAADLPPVYSRDPMAPRDDLADWRRMPRIAARPVPGPRPQRVNEQGRVVGISATDRTPAPGESAGWVVRTALCVEARQGRLYVFMPPTEVLEDYLALVAAVEATASALHMPVIVEGYAPPEDARLRRFKITPDPGVIEVNVHPSRSWGELVDVTATLYEEARLVGLGTEKFMLDGRHSGTGGGNHVVIGGPTPADSPMLRRPDLLRSIVGYWLNHPSLSYLFSGLFIGPTSQAPRVDEGRQDAVYELEIAFEQIPGPGDEPCPPWLVDRVFRHLLTDVTGNTHRAEICIDKLYAPETASGRLGLLELRAFEMPPHPRMSLTQQLLLRALIAWFWTQPYQERPIRWGTQLHDRFVLPHHVREDFRGVLQDLERAGYPIQLRWFDPHFEFRFPLLGSVEHGGIGLELRQAIEPWHVLGEEPGGGGAVRYVDSSVERLEVKATNLVDGRHVVTCNGRRVPLRPTGTHGEAVAGVRYRAWQPPSCLHPTIPVHTPLIFDVLDVYAGRSIGGCTYHVAHPGGRSYDTFPVNANEAESRRATRFFPIGHTGGTVEVPAVEVNRQFPATLDLRRSTRG